MVTKRDLGVSYLLGVGLGLIASLTWILLLADTVSLGLVIAIVTAAILSGTFVFIGYWMYHTGIAGDTAWTVAEWSALGLSVPVLVTVGVLQLNPRMLIEIVVPGILVNIIAAGGVLGLLLGLVLEMHREQSDMQRLHQRNKVLNRVLRHNIRNDMGVIQLHVDLLDEEGTEDENESFDILRRKIQDVVSTSDMARRIDQLDSDSLDNGPIDIVELIEKRVAVVQSAHPDVTVRLDLPKQAMAAVGPIFASVIDNVIENAIDHNDGEPDIDITVDPPTTAGSPVRIAIADDGGGIPDSEVRMLAKGEETQLEHTTGLGLWLVMWIVDHYDGDVRIESPESGGTRVILSVPSATGETSGRFSLRP